jgi:predicted DNA-binding protein YlxM (UPF0122 family)
MADEQRDALEKTTRINMLFDLYGSLLTEKQVSILTYYFLDDFSLGEIAEELGVSRQAVYEHVKRGGAALEDYEAKLGLLSRSLSTARLLDELQDGLEALASTPDVIRLAELAEALRESLMPEQEK